MELVEYGVDFIRVTTSDELVAIPLRDVFEAAWLDEWIKGANRKPRSMLGYDGEGWEHGFMGQRNDGWMLQLSGGISHDYARKILIRDVNCTRIDLQLTFKLDIDNPGFGKTELEKAEGRKWRGEVHQGTNFILIDGRGKKGDTVQIGARSSENYGRLYDKARESGEDIYEQCWRYEVEYKGDAARYHAKALAQNIDRKTIAGILKSRFSDWGFSTDWFDALPIGGVQYKRSSYDKDRILSWLAKQVNPSIQKLLQNGTGLDELGAVLGLDIRSRL